MEAATQASARRCPLDRAWGQHTLTLSPPLSLSLSLALFLLRSFVRLHAKELSRTCGFLTLGKLLDIEDAKPN